MTACALFQTSALPTLAKAQQGLFTHTQAASVGVLDRPLRGLVANGTITRLASGLYVRVLDTRVRFAQRRLIRATRHALLAFTTLRYGSGDLRGDPCAVARQVAAALRVAGDARRWGRPRA